MLSSSNEADVEHNEAGHENADDEHHGDGHEHSDEDSAESADGGSDNDGHVQDVTAIEEKDKSIGAARTPPTPRFL